MGLVTQTSKNINIANADGSNVADVNSSGQLHVVQQGKLDTDNSTDANLLADAVFTGASIDTADYSALTIAIETDVASATDGLRVQYSDTGSTWYEGETYTIPANSAKFFTPTLQSKYMRIIYTNGAAPTTDFHIHTMLRKNPIKWSSHNIEDPIKAGDDAELVKAVITGIKPNGEFDNASLTNGGNVKVSLEEFEDQVSVNGNSQLKTTLYDEGGIPISVDDATETLQIITYEHHEIHSGSHFNYCDYALSQANGAIIEFVITTPNTTEWTHLTFAVSASDGATIELYEGASGITGGTSITPRNNNRNSAHASTLTITKDPSAITSDGTRAGGYLAGGGRTAGAIGRDREFVLKQNELYLVRITSLAVSNDISWCADWYEHTDKN